RVGSEIADASCILIVVNGGCGSVHSLAGCSFLLNYFLGGGGHLCPGAQFVFAVTLSSGESIPTKLDVLNVFTQFIGYLGPRVTLQTEINQLLFVKSDWTQL